MAQFISKQSSWKKLIDLEAYERNCSSAAAEYYQALHDDDPHYKENNWLMEYLPYLSSRSFRSLTEIGAGNGKFAMAIAEKLERVYAIDWAKSPSLTESSNLTFIQKNALKAEYPTSDIVCSADVLEHFHPGDMDEALEAFNKASPKQFHVVACYDDRHSHLTVMPPSAWLSLFRGFDDSFRIHALETRRNDPSQIICALTNLQN